MTTRGVTTRSVLEAGCTHESPEPAVERAELDAAVRELENESRFGGAGVAERAEQVAAAAHVAELTELELRAALVGADMRRRDGGAADALDTVQGVRRWAADHGSAHLRSRCAYLLAAVWQELGDLAAALEHAIEAVELQDDDTPVALQIDHVARLADCLGLNRDDSAGHRYAEVLALARQAGDVRRELLVLNNWAYTEVLAGRPELALTLADQLRTRSAEQGRALSVGSLDTIARVLMSLDRLAEAEAVLLPGLRADALQSSGDGDAGADFLLTLAEVQRRTGATVQAQRTLDECVRRCELHGLTGIRVRARREQSELHAVGEDFQAAYTELGHFVDQLLELQSAQRDARARALQAVFETTEARQQSRRYRELALRDALTGLYNRRWVDEQLPRLLAGDDADVADAPSGSGTLTVALLDLDHFKAVNDTCSHDVGDQVLTVVAGLLHAATETDGVALGSSFAARMGGEEFLLVLTDEDRAGASRLLESVRRGIAEHPWTELTGTVPVTVSIGATTVDLPSEVNPVELLRRADARLYQAKGRGRDCVVGDQDR